MNWTFLAVLIVIAVSMIVGGVKGLVKSLFSMLALAVIVVATILLAPRLRPIVAERTGWDEVITEQTAQYLDEQGVLIHELDHGIDEELLSSLWIPGSIREQILEESQTRLSQGLEAYNAFLTEKVSDALFSVVVYAAVFFLVSLLVLIVWILLNVLTKLPGLKQANHFGGVVLGLVRGLVFVEVFFVLVTMLSQFGWASVIGAEIQANPILQFLYDRNPLMLLLLR